MISYLIMKDHKFDFSNPLDVEHPFSFNLKTISPTTQIYLVEYALVGNEYVVKNSLQKDAVTVVKSIINLYPNLIFSLNLDFWQDDETRLLLLKTCLRTLKKRHELKNKNEKLSFNEVELFEQKYLNFLKEHQIGNIDEISSV